jgi:uncharacterized protein YerC
LPHGLDVSILVLTGHCMSFLLLIQPKLLYKKTEQNNYQNIYHYCFPLPIANILMWKMDQFVCKQTSSKYYRFASYELELENEVCSMKDVLVPIDIGKHQTHSNDLQVHTGASTSTNTQSSSGLHLFIAFVLLLEHKV